MRNGLMIKANKGQLLDILRENRQKHKEAYELAREGFRQALVEELEELIGKVDEDSYPDYVTLQNSRAPQCHLDDYDNAIGMLELSTSQEVDLDESLYRKYVQDDWGWKSGWIEANSAYTASVRS